MPLNKRGGKKHKKGKNKTSDDNTHRRVEYADKGQVYCVVKKRVGGSHLEVLCSDGRIRKAIIPGKFRKRVWMNPNDVILCSLESVGKEDMCYIDHKYHQHDVLTLRSQGLLNFENDGKEGDEQTELKFEEDLDDKKSKKSEKTSNPYGDLFVNPNRRNSDSSFGLSDSEEYDDKGDRKSFSMKVSKVASTSKVSTKKKEDDLEKLDDLDEFGDIDIDNL